MTEKIEKNNSKERAHKLIHQSMFPPCLLPVNSNDESKYYLTRRGEVNNIIPHEEAYALLKAALNFYDNCSKEVVKKCNDEINRQYEAKIFGTSKPSSKPSSKPNRKKHPGYIYFLKDDTDRIKIGKSTNIDNRIFNIGIKLPVLPILYHFFKTNDMTKSEEELHEKYSEYRLNGEWFELPEKELEHIKNNYN